MPLDPVEETREVLLDPEKVTREMTLDPEEETREVPLDPKEETREVPLDPEEETQEAPSDREDKAQVAPSDSEEETLEALSDPEEETLEAPSNSEETKDVAGLAEEATDLEGPVVSARRKLTISGNPPPNNVKAHLESAGARSCEKSSTAKFSTDERGTRLRECADVRQRGNDDFAAAKGGELRHFDAEHAFLKAGIDKDNIYIEIP